MFKTLCAIAVGALILSSASSGATPVSGAANSGLTPEVTIMDRLVSLSTPGQVLNAACCKTCRKGKPCGDSCISKNKTCHKGPGCAC